MASFQTITSTTADDVEGATSREGFLAWAKRAIVGLLQLVGFVGTTDPATHEYRISALEASGPTIPEVTSDPGSPSPGDSWVLRTSSGGVAGAAMGVLGLTYAGGSTTYQLSYRTAAGTTKRATLS